MIKLFLVGLVLVFLSACGGGSGGNSTSNSAFVTASEPFLKLPVSGFSHKTAPLASVYDHSLDSQGGVDSVIQAFDGTVAESIYGAQGLCYQTSDFGAITLSGVFYRPSSVGVNDNLYMCKDDGLLTQYNVSEVGVIAAASGIVTQVARDQQGLTGTIHINHGNGFATSYENLQWPHDVAEGQRLSQGERLGAVADNQQSFSFGVIKNCDSQDTHCDVTQGDLVDPFGFKGTHVLWSDWSYSPASTTDILQGIDVSRSRGLIDWQQVRQSGVTFAFARASEGYSTYPGEIVTDSRYVENIENAVAAGVMIGAYHVIRPDFNKTLTSIRAEAENFYSTVNESYANYRLLPPVISIEGRFLKNMSRSEVSDWILEFIKEFRKGFVVNVVPIIYMNSYTENNFVDTKLASYPLWIASYGVNDGLFSLENSPELNAWNNWLIWQYSSVGSVPGVSIEVDNNVFRGTREDLEAFLIGGDI